MSKEVSLSLDDLDANKASETPFEFEYVKPNGDKSGIKLKVLGGQCDSVRAVAAELINERRKKEAYRKFASGKAGRGAQKPEEVDTVESDIEFGQRLAAVRLVGWSGIKNPWTAEGSLWLCQHNVDIANQVMEQSDNLANFMKG
jgi:hypothetical protein